MHKCIKILAKRKRGNKFPLRGNEVGAQERDKRQGMEQNRKQIQGLMKPTLAEYVIEEKRKLAHEYVIFYRRGNYLIEGETSPINRSLISSHFIHPSLRDLRDSLSRTLAENPLSLSLVYFRLFLVLAPRSSLDLVFSSATSRLVLKS